MEKDTREGDKWVASDGDMSGTDTLTFAAMAAHVVKYMSSGDTRRYILGGQGVKVRRADS
jgi:hypothetical protein